MVDPVNLATFTVIHVLTASLACFNLTLLDQVLHADQAVIFTLHALKQCHDLLIHLVVLVANEALTLAFDLLVLVHLFEEVVDSVICLILLEGKQVLEVLDLLAFKVGFFKLLSRQEIVVKVLDLIVFKVKVRGLAENFSQVVEEQPEIPCFLM